MEFENEITVEVDTSLENLIKILEMNDFKLREEYDLNDIYMIHKSDNEKKEDYLSMLNRCILIRDIIENDEERKMLTYKYKEYNENKEITKQGKIKCSIDNVENAQMLFEKLNFEKLIEIKDHMSVYANKTDELAIQCVNGKHVYIEVETKCSYAEKNYESIDQMKNVFSKYSIPIKDNNYFVKKAEIELQETYG